MRQKYRLLKRGSASKAFNLESSAGSRKFMQALDAPGKTEKVLITNKVSTHFSVSPCTPISYMPFPRPTEDSRLKSACVRSIHTKLPGTSK